jgi:hypothetical protein
VNGGGQPIAAIVLAWVAPLTLLAVVIIRYIRRRRKVRRRSKEDEQISRQT